MEGFLVWFIGAIAVISVLIFCVFVSSKKTDANMALLISANQEFGTNFQGVDENPGSVMGFFGSGLIFDIKAKKVLIFTGSGTGDVVGYDYFKTWQVTYNIKERAYSGPDYLHVMLKIETSDFDRPILQVSFGSYNNAKLAAEAWSAKLGALLS